MWRGTLIVIPPIGTLGIVPVCMLPIGLITNDSWFMMGFFRASISLLLLSLLFTSPVVAQTKLEIIPLKNRLVEEVFPTIRMSWESVAL